LASTVSATAGPNETRPVLDSGVYAAIRKASQASGTPFELMMASAKLESGFQPEAQSASSSASGLFQFTQQTWLSTVQQYGAAHGMGQEAAAIVNRGGRLTTADPALRKRILDMRNDPTTAAALAGDYMRDMANSLSTSLGRPAAPGEVYLAHFLGIGGAKQMLTAAPSQIAADVAPTAAQANGTMFYAKDGTPYTVAQFLQRVQGKVKQAANDVAPLVSRAPMTMADANSHLGTTTSNAGSSSPVKAGVSAADPPDADTSGWGTATPTALRSLSESQVLASLMTAFTYSNRDNTISKPQRNALGPEMPPAVLTALQMSEPAG